MSHVNVESDCKCSKCGVPLEAICKQESDGTLVVEDLIAAPCWYCDASICPSCFEGHGHCGHKEADTINYALRYMPSYRRTQIIRVLRHGERCYQAWN